MLAMRGWRDVKKRGARDNEDTITSESSTLHGTLRSNDTFLVKAKMTKNKGLGG
jgi:hypothetical protein